MNPEENVKDVTLDRAQEIVKAPATKATERRYKKVTAMYVSILKEMTIIPEHLDTSGQRDRKRDPVAAALKLIMQRCGPKEDGYDGLSAAATGASCKSAIVAFWRTHGHFGGFEETSDGGYRGNPGRCPSIQDLINKLDIAQRRSGTHKVSRAYQQTHEDVRKICKTFFDPEIEKALSCDPSVDYAMLQAAVMNCCQFGTVSRADELIHLRMENLKYSGDSLDTTVCGVIPITKAQKKKESYLVFQRAVHRGFCPLEKILLWQAVLLAHGITSGPVFVMISKNKLHGNRMMAHSSYAANLRTISKVCGIPNLREHSARRGGLGYLYFVLRRDLLFLFHSFLWEDVGEMIKYLGLEDQVNSYALLGFSDLKINQVR